MSDYTESSELRDEVESFKDDAFQEDIARIITQAADNPGQDNVLSRLATLTKKLSGKKNGPFDYEIDPNDFDLHKILHSFIKSADEQGIHLRSSGVVFKDVTTKGIDAEFSIAPTARDLLLGPIDAIRSIRAPKRADKKIVRNISGVVKPGEMCLVLGRPGAGCSTLLKTIAGEQDQFTSVEGEIHYDGIPQNEMIKKYKSDVIYNGELDVHYPHLTVDQTLRFAIACKTPITRVNNSTREQYITANRDLLATIFGLTHTYNTKVGNDFIRGVSGGERKRVSIAEAMAAKGTVYCWDNATRGLDASTALEYAQAIRTSTNLTKSVAFITIYQAGENIYETFDKVLVLYEGRQVYFGPAEQAKQYFIDMGFDCPQRQATAEFLTAITDPAGRFPRAGFENRVPLTADQFETYWRNSQQYQSLQHEIDQYESSTSIEATRQTYDKSLAQERKKAHSRYTIGYLHQLKLLTLRGFQRIWGDKSYTLIDLGASVVQSLIAGSLFWNTPGTTSGAFSRGGIVFFMILYFCLMSLSQITAQFAERPILLKQKSYSFFHPSAEAIASTFTHFPFRVLSTFLFYVIMYFLADLTRDAGKFFMNLLFLIISAEAVSALFQMIASLSATAAGANSVAGVIILLLILYTGYMIQLKSMHPWFKWLSYLNPIRWGYENMMSTEFHGKQMDCGGSLVPSGAGYPDVSSVNQVCAFVGSETGQTWVSGDNYIKIQYDYKFSHVWRNFGFVIAYALLFMAINAIATEFKKVGKGGGDHLFFKRGSKYFEEEVLLDEDIKEKDSENVEDEGSQQDQLNQLKRGKTENEQEIFKGLGSKGVFFWRNVDYVIPYKGSSRKLLDDIQGYVKPGTITALMGESGAGKTTLLNVLSQRVDVGTISGDFLVNGKPLDTSFKRSTGYVQQQDLHVDELTVRESLQFAARLRRPASVSEEEKLDYVEKIISLLGMELYSDATVGKLGSGLNVEQRKKLSIGVELVAKPSLLLFLDEPTSGLDSQSAWAIVSLLKKLAAAGQSILCTIHQPSATLFESFDRLLLLKKGGKTVYFGDIGENSRTILDYFERNGARHCETHENPAEYILEAIGAGATASVKEDWFVIWTASQEYINTTNEVNDLVNAEYEDVDAGLSDQVKKELHLTYAIPYRSQLYYLIKRTGTQFYRDPEYLRSKLMLLLGAGLLIGFTFYGIKSSIVGLQNAMFVSFLVIVLGSPSINQIQARSIAAREIYEVRESKSNTYHWSTLLIAQFVNELPYQFLFSTIFFVSLYFPLRVFTEASRSGVFFLFLVIIYQLYVVSLGLAIVYFSPDLPSAAVITGLIMSFLISFCGVTQPSSLMPKFWTFMYRVSPVTYFIEVFTSLLIHKKPVICAPDELSYFNPPSGQTCYEFAQPYVEAVHGYLSNPNATSSCGYCTYSIGDEYLKTIDVSYSHLWRNFGIMWGYIIFNLVAMCGLYFLFRVAKFNPIESVKKLIPSKKEVNKSGNQ